MMTQGFNVSSSHATGVNWITGMNNYCLKISTPVTVISWPGGGGGKAKKLWIVTVQFLIKAPASPLPFLEPAGDIMALQVHVNGKDLFFSHPGLDTVRRGWWWMWQWHGSLESRVQSPAKISAQLGIRREAWWQTVLNISNGFYPEWKIGVSGTDEPTKNWANIVCLLIWEDSLASNGIGGGWVIHCRHVV